MAWTPYDVSTTPSMSGYAHAVQGPSMAMGRWVAEATMALARTAEAATTLEGLRSCSIIHTYLASTALAVAWTPYDVRETQP